MKGKFIFILLALIVLPSGSLFASNKIIWTWHEPNSKVSWYRYQINSFEDLEVAWTYMPNIKTKRYIITDVDPSVSEYVLYIQSSYDGISWSDTARSVVNASVYQYLDK